MEKKRASSIVLFLLLLCAVLSALIVPSARSDIVPVNTNLLYLQSENVRINVGPDNDGYVAEVRGVYPVQLIGNAMAENHATQENLLENLRENALSEMTIMFPVPTNSENISVEVFGENIKWEWADKEYPTELGNFPIVKWTFRIPENMIKTELIDGIYGTVYSDIFNIVVEYAHQLPIENGRYVLLYSLGAAGYLGAYNYVANGASMYIETKLPKEVEIVEAKLTKFDNLYPPEFNIDKENNRVTMTCLTGYNTMYDTGDYVIEFTTPVRNVDVSISSSENSAEPRENATFTLTVANTGNVADNYSLTVGDNSGWEPTLSENFLLNVENGASRTVTLTVTIPASAENRAQDRITVTARSRTDNAIENNTTCTATATKAPAPSRGVSLIVYVGVAVVIVVIIAAVLILKFV